MKIKLITTSLLLAAAAMQSCSDDEPIKGTPLEEGDEIEFGASLPDEVLSRTYYGPEAVVGQKTIWPIYWNYQTTKPKDQIFIYSPQALDGRNQATYQVMATEENCKTAVDIQKLPTEPAGIQVGTASTYDFYAMYPASAVKSGTQATGTPATFQANLATTQTVTLATDKDATAMTTTPDMNYCLMTGMNTGVTLEQGTKVPIQFKPFATALDITINGMTESATSQAVQITSVIITANKPIVGDFKYQFPANSTEKGTLTVDEQNSSNELEVVVQNEQGFGITLGVGQSLNLQAFILPEVDVNDLKVIVKALGGGTWTQTLNMTNANVEASNILKVKLANLQNQNFSYDYKTWISQLNDNTYISDISLPGAALAFNTAKNGVATSLVTQYTNLEGLFNAGIRAFQSHIRLDPNATSTVDGQAGSFYICTSVGDAVKDPADISKNLTLYRVLSALVDQMAGTHSDEFCVLLLSDYGFSGTTEATFYQRLNTISNYPEFKDKLILGLSPNTTLKEAKGKVIIRCQLNTNDTDNNPEEMVNTVNAWLPLNGSQLSFNIFATGVGSNVGYSPLTFGNVGSEIKYNTNSDGSKPYITSSDEQTLMWYVASRKINSATWRQGILGNYWLSSGSVGLTTVPDKTSLESGFWFIYGDQANAGTNQSAVNSNITNMINAISNTYTDARNKYYMTYCGGAPNTRTLTTMTDMFNSTWTNGVQAIKDKPWGWVMLNCIGDDTTPSLTSTKDAIQAIINHNGVADKDGNVFHPGIAKAAPAGDMVGTKAGGSLFGN